MRGKKPIATMMIEICTVEKRSQLLSRCQALQVHTVCQGEQVSLHATSTAYRVQPPIGDRQWAAPELLDPSSRVYDSTVFGPSCPQYVTAVPSVWALDITGNLIVNYGESLTAGLVAQNSAEDCFTLAIWTPTRATLDSKLPVIHFLTGGGDVTGGINISPQMPSNWIHRSQKHIVVTTNYRVNIFGYPNARGLNGGTNFALQDQRKAVERVAENIEAFGGDPMKITLWGQSAGSSATDQYLFAWYQNPIIRASISSSGLAIGGGLNQDYTGTNFTFVAKYQAVASPTQISSLSVCDVFPCRVLRILQANTRTIKRLSTHLNLQFLSHVKVCLSLPLSLSPILNKDMLCQHVQPVDNKFVFSNYTQRYLTHRIAPLPKIIGTTAREASALLPYPIHNASAGPSPQLIYTHTLATVCAAHNTSVLRNEIGLATYRYEWAGNFSNIAPVDWLGAYHYSDLYMIFGTYLIAPGSIPELEVQTSEGMQDYLLDFITDPSSLPGRGWPG